ncbi:DMT family transporter [Aliagarivorans taiwanensis]|uniref:DMT family transporter n=1 Tax=Aliagarivorans taiwanensis TaxID=561966 RepID=UPI00041B2A0A|nr:DMT family transporter [Aliagarivorans taiwanensis]
MHQSPTRIAALLLALLAFAGNSLLTRAALLETPIDPLSFSLLRLYSGCITLLVLARLRRGRSLPEQSHAGSRLGGVGLIAYMLLFTFAYREMSTAVGALLLFASVQISLWFWSRLQGEGYTRREVDGVIIAFAGLVLLLAKGWSTPAVIPALQMVVAGIAWAGYTLAGKGAGEPLLMSSGNFILASLLSLLALPLYLVTPMQLDTLAVGYALLSGMLCSAIGYALWYFAIAPMRASLAGVLQLSVPLIAALMGAAYLQEALSLELLLSMLVVLLGILLVMNPRLKRG